MDRKERIVEFMKSEEYLPLKEEELIAVLGVPKSDTEEFKAVLKELVMEGKVLPVRKNRFKAAEKNIVTGRLRCSRHGFFGFVEASDENGDIFISGENLGDAIDGDFAAIMIETPKTEKNMREGRVIKVLERGNKRITGIVTKTSKTLFFIKPDNDGIFVQVTARAADGVQKGDRVLLDIKEYSKSGDILCAVVSNLGKAEDFKSCVEAAIYRHEIKREFDEETLNEAKTACGGTVSAEGRLDLRGQLIFTIDGDDARDFDDAVSVEKLENGNFRLGVHIADVTHYVRPETALDNEAFLRGTSVYLADRVIPMLPPELSNGICSLNPGEDRYTLSLFMEIDKNGDVLSHELFKSVIRSSFRLTYNIAAELLEGEDEALKKEYKEVVPALKKMKRLAGYLNKKRMKRGSINFDFPEAKIYVDEKGYPVSIKKEERKVSHKIIEEFMLVANETVAEYAFWAEIPFVYRVHEPPSPEKIDSFSRFIFNFGLVIKGRTDKDEGIHPKALQKILEKIEGTPEEEMISRYMLRSLMKAEYKPQNSGHFGLAAKYYCHFTSPIRRYPDLMIHRILKDFLDGKSLEKYEIIVNEAAKHSSETERNAELLERDVDDLMKARYMSKFIGESFEGRISGVTKFGLFVELENTIEGLVRLENMHDDFYVYDEDRRMVIGERRKKKYKIGDSFRVMAARCDYLTGSIDFLPADADLGALNKFYGNLRKRQDDRQDLRRNVRRRSNNKVKRKGRGYGRV